MSDEPGRRAYNPATMDERATRQSNEWYLVHAFRRTLWHIDEGWDEIDAGDRRAWMRMIAIGFVALVALTLALVFFAQNVDLRDRELYSLFRESVRVPHSWAIWLESPGNGIVLWPVVLTAAGIAAWRRRPLVALTILVGFVLLDGAVLVGWNVWERPRPTAGHTFNAFPSGHVSQTLVAYGLLIELWLQQTRIRGERLFAWSFLALLAVMVAVGRVALGAHWPSDIAAGAILGLFWLIILIRALRRGERARMMRKHA